MSRTMYIPIIEIDDGSDFWNLSLTEKRLLKKLIKEHGKKEKKKIHR
ncbi:unnamed protein product [marine sediment metagenome]|uniref:Uncharacterized protein n=1 Tax=marine sediment metagenome TaxID=412755 RepID=X0YFW6_9ZZZZ